MNDKSISQNRTLLDIPNYTAAGSQAMRDRDKLKDDAIAQLSDQLIALTARLDSIEKQR